MLLSRMAVWERPAHEFCPAAEIQRSIQARALISGVKDADLIRRNPSRQ
jgi:hypothetical protein